MAKYCIEDFIKDEMIQKTMERRVTSGVEPLMRCKLIKNEKQELFYT